MTEGWDGMQLFSSAMLPYPLHPWAMGSGTETPSTDSQGSCCNLKMGSHKIPTSCLLFLHTSGVGMNVLGERWSH